MTTTNKLTVFIPTYNRSYVLPRAYDSLINQTCNDFSVIIVDDGSTDDTEELVGRWKESGPLDITYLRQPNGGKMRAHNAAVRLCETELFLTLDSDDWLVPSAVEDILRRWDLVTDASHVAGIVALRGSAPGIPLKDVRFPENLTETTFWNLIHKTRHTPDTALVYRTDLLKRFPYKVADGEKFIAEPYVYYQIDELAPLLVLNDVIMVTDYLADGYTANAHKITRENPRGYMELKRSYVSRCDTFSGRFENAVLSLVGAHFAHATREGMAELNDPLLAFLSVVPAKLLAYTVFSERWGQ